MALDTAQLERLVELCFAYARDDSLNRDQQDAFLFLGQHFRNDLRTATETTWSADDTTLANLNAEMNAAITAISDEAAVEASFAATIAKVTKVLNIVDTILAPK